MIREDRLAAWVDGVPIEEEALAQARRIANHPGTFRHVAIMPDAHVGIGATVGTVFASEKVLIPAAVGVDIGCGMIAQRLVGAEDKLHSDADLAAARSAIEAAIPHGRTDDGGKNDRGAWGDVPATVGQEATRLLDRGDFKLLLERHPKSRHHRPAEQLGTLGTGNHFVELCADEDGRAWIMLHSGSRGPGNRIASHFIRLAKAEMERWMIQLPDKDLAYLPEGSEHFQDYVRAVNWAQEYARTNRMLMLDAAIGALRGCGWEFEVPEESAVNCHHNYVSQERHFGKNVWVTRKGAVSAQEGELGIIPGSMGARSYIVAGKGNRDSFHSCSHGAGRRGSRRWARETFTVEDHAKATEGVECRKDEGALDETPAAYKDIEAVMAAQADLVEPVHTLKQVLCVKG